MRLENTQFFEEVNVVPESTNIPQRKNLKISVKEGRTGNSDLRSRVSAHSSERSSSLS